MHAETAGLYPTADTKFLIFMKQSFQEKIYTAFVSLFENFGNKKWNFIIQKCKKKIKYIPPKVKDHINECIAEISKLSINSKRQ